MSPRNSNTRAKQKKNARRARWKPKTGRARAFLWWLIGLCTAVILVLVFVLSDHGLYQLSLLKREQHAIEQHIQELEKENAVLAQERDRLENDLQYIEKLARERYRMAKPDEKVFRVIPRSERENR